MTLDEARACLSVGEDATEPMIKGAAATAMKLAHPDTRVEGIEFNWTVQQVKQARDLLLYLPSHTKELCRLCRGVGMIRGIVCGSCGGARYRQ